MEKEVSIVISPSVKNYRKLAQQCYGLNDEQMIDMDVHHNPPRHLGGRNVPEHLFVYHYTLHAAVHSDNLTEWARRGGKKGGKVSDSSFGGRASCSSMKESKTGFFDPKWGPLRKEWVSLAGQARAQQMGIEGYPGLGQSFEAASSAGKKAASQKWEDPDHPELGIKSAGTLVLMQKSRGYDHGKENRRMLG